jgi:hypothetical protein
MLKKLALAVMIVCGVAAAQNVTAPATLDPGVVYTTGNLVQPTTTTTGSTWVNGVYQDQLTCWAWGDPGYCGPNAIVRPGNNINFSFGVTDLYQVQTIASVLPSGGSGLRVNGYNFGFTAKNGNGWDGGGLDTLSAYVNFYGSDGKTVRSDYYNLNYKFDWTTFNYSKTFDSPYATKDLSTVRYGLVGGDTSNYWAGPYGPEVMNVSFSLKYSVDPCATNPLYSPTCPGYMDALSKLVPATVAVTEPVAVTTTITEPMAAPITNTTSTNTTPSSQPSAVASVVSAPVPAPSSTTTSAAASNTRENSGTNTSQAMSIISRNQERDRETLAVAQTAVSAATAAAAAAQQEAVAVAATAVANSTNNNAAAVGGSNAGTGLRASSSAASNSTTQASAVQLMPGMSTVSVNAPQSQSVNTSALTSATTTTAAPVTQTQSLSTTGTGSNTAETNVALSSNFLTDRSNPINAVLEQRLPMPSTTTATTGPSVNTKVADNEAAGGVSIATMAVAPVGYGDYLNFVMRDAAFYAPREVYRNQRNVDNQRALRQLTNDSRHREMVEQQYRR